MSRILLFDDDTQQRNKIRGALSKLVVKQADVVPFDDKEG